MNQPSLRDARYERGIALLATLFALTLLMLLALPFAVSMGVGADAAARDVERTDTAQAAASARDLLLAAAAMSSPGIDPTPTYDSLDEFPDHVELPAAFAPLRRDGRVLLGGEVTDLQRKLGLDGVSPLVLTNLLGNTTWLHEAIEKDALALTVEAADALPEAGFVWIGHELIHYGGRQGNSLVDLERGMQQDLGFTEPAAHAEGALVLDYRCVLAAAWPFLGVPEAARGQRVPCHATSELAAIVEAGAGAFTATELEVFGRALSPNTQAATAATWGRPERVFEALQGGKSRSLRVRSALQLGAGSTVRLRNLRTGAVEFGLVMSTRTERGATDLLLPSVFRLGLLQPVGQDFPAIDTVVEPLIPAPVNLNTASLEVLTALFTGVRRDPGAEVHGADGRRAASPPMITQGLARELAGEIVTLRAGDARNPGMGPFTGWRDVAERLWKSRLDAAQGAQKGMWLDLYRALETGRDSVLEMGTAPICFQSGPWIEFRAAAAESRSVFSPGTTARQERTGLAAAIPGFRLERTWNTQEAFEEAFRLDRRAPGWTTLPVNLGGLERGSPGNDPAARYFANVVPIAYPGIGLGEPRFAATDEADSGIRPATATTPSGRWSLEQRGFDSMAEALNPRGHDVARDGPYLMTNTGPTGSGDVAPKSARHGPISFPFTVDNGGAGRFAVSFWAEPKSLEGTTLLDYGTGDPDRNRIAVHGRDGQLRLEVLDEAGQDPNWADSPAGVERTATEWTLPLAELGLPANTPVHLAMSAYGSRPTELSFAVDGVTRGKPKYASYLTATIKVFDPTLNVGGGPGQFTGDRYLDVQVESTDGFPKVGILRIGAELFEYSAISGNSFQCRYKDSVGQRGARQAPSEMRPAIPLDENGQPKIDISELQQQGANLDVFPEHPVGSLVELYGYSALLSEDSPMMPGQTQLGSVVGGFAVARGFIANPQQLTVTVPATGQSFPIGRGIDSTWSGVLELAAPVPTGRDYPPPDATAEVTDAFATTGGYALLIQRGIFFQSDVPGSTTTGTTAVGGVELIRYTSRQGNKLNGIQRGQQLPGQNAQIKAEQYDGTARKFVMEWPQDWLWGNTNSRWSEVPTNILWVVPISLPIADTRAIWDPAATKLTEWLQLYPKGGKNDNDIEWVRYDTIADRHVVRANRAAWDGLRFVLTDTQTIDTVRVGPLGPGSSPNGLVTAPWGTIAPTSGYIGYTPRLESTYPQIAAARRALGFRGDPFTGTSSHAHPDSVVTQCQRLQLNWGNWGAFTGRAGRHDRVAIVQGSVASGQNRPAVEWHTVTWSARRFNADNLQRRQQPAELLGPWPFQLVAFTDAVKGAFVGPARGTVVLDPRQYDRVVKFPSGELPAAYCGEVTAGAGVGNVQPMAGYVDEVEVTQHVVPDLVVEDSFPADARTFRVDRSLTYTAVGPLHLPVDPSAALPEGGGLLWIDGEVIAYQSRSDGEITVAQNGRALLNTEPRGHDRGSRVHFLTHRPAAILSGGVGSRDEKLPVQAVGALPRNGGLLLLGRELLHYTWIRAQGDQVTLEMPRWLPPGEDERSPQARGLFRGSFGTTVQSGSSGEAVIGFPFRYWDRYRDQSDDPELAYFQLTTNEAPVYFGELRWRQETEDPRVRVVGLARTDSRADWAADPQHTAGLWRFVGGAGDAPPHRLDTQAARLELRFAATYEPGVIDLVAFQAHGWKTSVRIRDVRLDYDGQGCIFDERVTER